MSLLEADALEQALDPGMDLGPAQDLKGAPGYYVDWVSIEVFCTPLRLSRLFVPIVKNKHRPLW